MLTAVRKPADIGHGKKAGAPEERNFEYQKVSLLWSSIFVDISFRGLSPRG